MLRRDPRATAQILVAAQFSRSFAFVCAGQLPLGYGVRSLGVAEFDPFLSRERAKRLVKAGYGKNQLPGAAHVSHHSLDRSDSAVLLLTSKYLLHHKEYRTLEFSPTLAIHNKLATKNYSTVQ